jgi:DNA-binding beta-propeller fold protein YncE
MKNHLVHPAIIVCAFALVLCFTTGSTAKVEWEILKDVPLTDEPRDIAVAPDGATTYILCGKSIQIYSVRENKVTGNIPLTGDFSQIAVAPSGEQLFLTNAAGKQLSVIQISQVYDIPVGTSPVIGKEGAPVTVYAFLDYQ